MRLAVWSGPRNLSTAMMYAFGCRPDFDAVDEPFYAPFLAATGTDHPMRDAILAGHETDAARVGADLAQPGAAHRYFKVMPHHMEPGFPLDWAQGCAHVHLIRHPARVIASYAAKRAEVTLEDIGFPQQGAFLKQFPGLVLDSETIRDNPADSIRKICDHAEISFDPAMLTWPQGPKDFDGVWAAHWYGAVHGSTGFAGPEAALPRLEGQAAQLLAQALPIYDDLRAVAG